MQFQEDYWGKGSGMGIIWLCATLGPRHKRGPSKKQIQQCDVPDVCHKIVASDMPIPLRTSAGLLVGVVRVHDARYELFVHDVVNLEASVRKAMADMRSSGGGMIPGLDLANGAQARIEQITLPGKSAEDIGGGADWTVLQAADWEQFMKGYEGLGSSQSVASESGLESGRESTPSDRAARHVADPRDITLPMHRRRMSSLDLAGRDRAASQDLGADFDVGEEGINLGLDMGDLDAFGEGETSDLKARRGRESSVARLSLGGIGGIASSSAFDNGLNYDIPEDGLALGLEGFDDILQDEQRERAGSVTASEQARLDIAGGALEQERRNPLLGDLELPLNDDGLPQADPAQEDNAAANADETQAPAKKRKVKKGGPVIDEVLELTPEEAAEMRNNWAALMDAGRAEQREKDQERVVQEAAQEYLAAGPMRSLGLGGDMQDFWMAITSTSRISTLPQPGTKGTKRKVTDLEEEAVDLAAEEDPFGGYQADMDIPDFERAGTQDLDIEVARRVSLHSQKRSEFPWELPNAGMSDIGDAPAGPGSSITGTAARFSIDTPMDERRRERARSASVLSGRPGSAMGLYSGAGAFDTEVELPELDLEHRDDLNDASTQKSSLTGTTGKFLEYIKRISEREGKDVFDEDQMIDFEDIAPKATVARRVAAGAFYNCLSLATKDMITVRQAAPYAAIQVAINRPA